jgi:uncharacterized protein (TIGR02266 family)
MPQRAAPAGEEAVPADKSLFPAGSVISRASVVRSAGMPHGPKGLSLRVRLPYASEAEFLEGYGRNLSRSAIFVATESVRPAGTILALEVALADGRSLLRGDAVVAKEASRARAGMLLRFLTLDAPSRGLLDRAFTSPAEQAETQILGIDPGSTAVRVALSRNGQPVPVTRSPGQEVSRVDAFRTGLLEARRELGLPVARAVLAVPAHLGDRQREAVRDVAQDAGWRIEQVVSAPTAVAVAFAAGRALPRRRLCVIDFGARKLDVSIVEVEGDEVSVIACGGDATFGVESLDRLERIVLGVLVGARLTTRSIDALVLGGRMARNPDVRLRLSEEFRRAPEELDLEWGVAFGAALIGASLARPEGLSVNDLIPQEAPVATIPPLAEPPARAEARA